ncbi:copper resistance CopC family protein [Thioalkalivibrio sp. ALR17-21]|uniref:copper resistance CopC family protein n=1 Tax=Thioalkalivibrio sp. ALR17-21 TaxID=1269813 RepID=UPI000419082A|nr:copper resistance CopC family protein [Thioalkalivibrio sp. ALR17-21]
MTIRIRMTLRAALAALLLAFATPLMAHEGEMGQIPEDGSTVQDTPEEIGIHFDGAMRITQFDVTGPQGRVSLENQPGNEPTEEYRVRPAGSMEPGSYEVRWRGLARDGHMMSDTFRFTVED